MCCSSLKCALFPILAQVVKVQLYFVRNGTGCICAPEADGVVRRTPNPRDRRSSFLALTARGRRIYAAFTLDWRQFESEFNRLFSSSALRTLNASLESLAMQCLKHVSSEQPERKRQRGS